ncbi:alpha/beta hydrolase [Jannaschia pohangensis]|uniref:Alpha/beta hydrolase family protein n=1 Tax=Jannaschia pohangensis TaxID=390807 RepID=A0A1I3R4D0_9RHOB|nr:alpha/beta hydrolase [Jannaschia pohangensis]SFJ41434.1 hypothetical protein SAMN04488095_2791 [Jannaschia pohangensis]
MSNDPCVIVMKAAGPRNIVLFAAGRGGNPMRHLPLLTALVDAGSTVIAPQFDMLKTAVPEKEELEARIPILEAALTEHAPDGIPLTGVGHSIGAVVLLALVGGRGDTRAGDRFASKRPVRFDRLALLAPPTGFFRRPGALSGVDARVRIRVGAKDTITPPDQVLFLHSALQGHVPVSIQIDEDAGHFIYMNELPPGITDAHPDRDAFLEALSKDVSDFIGS